MRVYYNIIEALLNEIKTESKRPVYQSQVFGAYGRRSVLEMLEIRCVIKIAAKKYVVYILEYGHHFKTDSPHIKYKEYKLTKWNRDFLRIDGHVRPRAFLEKGTSPYGYHLDIKLPDVVTREHPTWLLNLILRPQTCNAINFLMYLHYRQLTGEAPV